MNPFSAGLGRVTWNECNGFFIVHLFVWAVSVNKFWLRVCYLVGNIGDDLFSRYDHSSSKSVIVQSRSFRCFETGFGVGFFFQRFSWWKTLNSITTSILDSNIMLFHIQLSTSFNMNQTFHSINQSIGAFFLWIACPLVKLIAPFLPSTSRLIVWEPEELPTFDVFMNQVETTGSRFTAFLETRLGVGNFLGLVFPEI